MKRAHFLRLLIATPFAALVPMPRGMNYTRVGDYSQCVRKTLEFRVSDKIHGLGPDSRYYFWVR